MSEQDLNPSPSSPDEQARRTAAKTDDLVKDVEPDDEGGIGNYEEHVGRGQEEDPGEA